MPYVGRNRLGKISHESIEPIPGLSEEFIEEDADELINDWRGLSDDAHQRDDVLDKKAARSRLENLSGGASVTVKDLRDLGVIE